MANAAFRAAADTTEPAAAFAATASAAWNP